MMLSLEDGIKLQVRLLQFITETNEIIRKKEPGWVKEAQERMIKMAESLSEKDCQYIDELAFELDKNQIAHTDTTFVLRALIKCSRGLRYKQN